MVQLAPHFAKIIQSNSGVTCRKKLNNYDCAKQDLAIFSCHTACFWGLGGVNKSKHYVFLLLCKLVRWPLTIRLSASWTFISYILLQHLHYYRKRSAHYQYSTKRFQCDHDAIAGHHKRLLVMWSWWWPSLDNNITMVGEETKFEWRWNITI